MEKSLIFSDTISKIAFTREFIGAGLEATVSGWGLISGGSLFPPAKLRYVVKRTISNQECRRSLPIAQAALILSSTLCTFIGHGRGT